MQVQTDVLGKFGRQKLREIGAVGDGLARLLDQVRASEHRLQQDVLPDLLEEQRKLPLQLEALRRDGPYKTEAEVKAFEERKAKIEAEIANNETAIAEVRAELARVQASASQPRDDRKAVIRFIDTITKHAGDEGARLRAEFGGRAA